MDTITRHARSEEQEKPVIEGLFGEDVYTNVLRSVHDLGKPTVAQLYRLHTHEVASELHMHEILFRLSGRTQQYLTCIKPLDINHPSRWQPHIYIDTTKSRRHLEAHPNHRCHYRRISEPPSRDLRFLYHDIGHVDELISYELTAQKHRLPFWYESKYDRSDRHIFPKVEIEHETLTHTIRPEPDKVFYINGYRIIHEHDCGEETIKTGNIIRDATIGRKFLVYDVLSRGNTFNDLSWDKTLYLYTIEGKKRTHKSTQARIKSCMKAIHPHVDEKRIYFANRLGFLEAGDDISRFEYTRGDGLKMKLPCFK